MDESSCLWDHTAHLIGRGARPVNGLKSGSIPFLCLIYEGHLSFLLPPCDLLSIHCRSTALTLTERCPNRALSSSPASLADHRSSSPCFYYRASPLLHQPPHILASPLAFSPRQATIAAGASPRARSPPGARCPSLFSTPVGLYSGELLLRGLFH
jgi:hypothetical protein